MKLMCLHQYNTTFGEKLTPPNGEKLCDCSICILKLNQLAMKLQENY